jgi:hypothetical protein
VTIIESRVHLEARDKNDLYLVNMKRSLSVIKIPASYVPLLVFNPIEIGPRNQSISSNAIYQCTQTDFTLKGRQFYWKSGPTELVERARG